MKRIVLIVLGIGYVLSLKAQKPTISLSTMGKWPVISSESVCANGSFAMYIESHDSVNAEGEKDQVRTLYIHATEGTRQFIKTGIKNIPQFSNDSKWAIYTNAEDDLCQVSLNDFHSKLISKVRSFQVAPVGDWLAWLPNSNNGVVVFDNLKKKQEYRLKDVISYKFDPDGKTISAIVKAKKPKDPYILQTVNLTNGYATEIWRGNYINRLTYDNDGQNLAFIGLADTGSYQLLYYNQLSQKVIAVVKDANQQLGRKLYLTVNSKIRFSKNGDKLLFKVDRDSDKVINGYNNVSIFNSADIYERDRPLETTYWAVANLKAQNIILLNKYDEHLEDNDTQDFENWLLLSCNLDLKKWYSDSIFQFKAVNLTDGRRLTIKPGLGGHVEFSPDERYLIWFNVDSLDYFAYDTSTGILRNITGTIPQKVYQELKVVDTSEWHSWGIAGYGSDRHSIYIYDQYDIWRIDLIQQISSNITNGFGRRNGIVFGINPTTLPSDRVINNNQPIQLISFNPNNKKNGFWYLNSSGSLVKQVEDTAYYYVENYGVNRTGSAVRLMSIADHNVPLKAKNANVFLLTRQSASDYPNLETTSNFKDFHRVSNFNPEKFYNWITAGLVSWHNAEGENVQGILYKPENFDQSKKYPVIINYYESRSDELYKYWFPEASAGNLNIPYFVSNGYLIFVPDIDYRKGHIGKSAVDAVTSGVNCISKLPFVDPTKIGIQGHSFGGYETNYIISHTSGLFAAACSSSGVADLTSLYLQFDHSGSDQLSLGNDTTPWNANDLFIENSPLYGVGTVSTPLLIVDGKHDLSGFFYDQALEMFHALRRADKIAWLLSYPNSGHGMSNDADAIDLTVRMNQFFDHYLKNKAMPVWMNSKSIEGQAISTSLDPEDLRQ